MPCTIHASIQTPSTALIYSTADAGTLQSCTAMNKIPLTVLCLALCFNVDAVKVYQPSGRPEIPTPSIPTPAIRPEPEPVLPTSHLHNIPLLMLFSHLPPGLQRGLRRQNSVRFSCLPVSSHVPLTWCVI